MLGWVATAVGALTTLDHSEWSACVRLSSLLFLSSPFAQLACRWERVDSHWHLGQPEGLAALICPFKSSSGVGPAVIGSVSSF